MLGMPILGQISNFSPIRPSVLELVCQGYQIVKLAQSRQRVVQHAQNANSGPDFKFEPDQTKRFRVSVSGLPDYQMVLGRPFSSNLVPLLSSFLSSLFCHPFCHPFFVVPFCRPFAIRFFAHFVVPFYLSSLFVIPFWLPVLQPKKRHQACPKARLSISSNSRLAQKPDVSRPRYFLKNKRKKNQSGFQRTYGSKNKAKLAGQGYQIVK